MAEKEEDYNPILELIPFGRNHAITREKLGEISGLTDRDVRECISKARRNTTIVNLQTGEGYFRPDPKDDEDAEYVNRFVKQEESRLKSIGWSLKAARKFLKDREAADNE